MSGITDGSGNAFVPFKLNDTTFDKVTSMDVRTIISYTDTVSPPLEYTENYDNGSLDTDGTNVSASHYFDLDKGLSIELIPTLNYTDEDGNPQSVTGDTFRVAPTYFIGDMLNSTITMTESFAAPQDNVPFTVTIPAVDIYQGTDNFHLYSMDVNIYNVSLGISDTINIVLDRDYIPGEDITVSGTLALPENGEYSIEFVLYGAWGVDGLISTIGSTAKLYYEANVGTMYTVGLPSAEALSRYGLTVSEPMLSLYLDDSTFTDNAIEAYAGSDVFVRYTLSGTPAPDPTDPDYDPLHDTSFYANITVPHADLGGRTIAMGQTSTAYSSYPAEFFANSTEQTQYMYFVFSMPAENIPAGTVKATEITISSTP